MAIEVAGGETPFELLETVELMLFVFTEVTLSELNVDEVGILYFNKLECSACL